MRNNGREDIAIRGDLSEAEGENKAQLTKIGGMIYGLEMKGKIGSSIVSLFTGTLQGTKMWELRIGGCGG